MTTVYDSLPPLTQLWFDIQETRMPSLAWAVEQAPDGDIDAALRRLWLASSEDHTMRRLGSLLEPSAWRPSESETEDYDPALFPRRTYCCRGQECRTFHCSACADAIRAAVPCPSLAAWLSMRQELASHDQ